VEDFQILRKIGEGTYSSVFKVRRLADDTIYALKRIKLDSMGQKDQESALNEVRILASLAHENIIAYRDAFYEKGCLFLVLEFAEAGDLAADIAAHRKEKTFFSEVEIWQVLLQVF
jgi:NIMA (never in mitosis gene a)-related kinase 1/4/5